MSETKLEPCPFCGVAARLVSRFTVACPGCDAEINHVYADRAIAAWNRRALSRPAPSEAFRVNMMRLCCPMLSHAQIDELIRQAQGASAPPDVPEGMRLVPVEPTEDMIQAGSQATGNWYRNGQFGSGEAWCYRAMLDAAPTPSVPSDSDDGQCDYCDGPIDDAACTRCYYAMNSPKQAMEVLSHSMKADSAYAWTWHCNIAMAAQDAGAPHGRANQRAAEFMFRAFGVDTSKFDEYMACASPTPSVPDGVLRKLDGMLLAAVTDSISQDEMTSRVQGARAAIASALAAAPAKEPSESDNSLVICPGCCHQFRAIPVEVQAELAALRARVEELVGWVRDMQQDRMYQWNRAEASEADARRYRGIMERAVVVPVGSGRILCLPTVRLYDSLSGPDFRGQHDAAIDAELTQPKERSDEQS